MDFDYYYYLVQRGHQNSLELMPVFFLLMVLGGIRHPCVCASLGSLYIVTRYFYFSGYATGDPKNRLNIGFVPSLCLPYSVLFEKLDTAEHDFYQFHSIHNTC